MRKYEELTQEEKEHLDENELNAYVEYELMEIGSAPESPGIKPTYPKSVIKETFYQVGSFIFRTMKEAEKMIALKPLIETYDYNIGYNVKLARERHPDDLRITIIELPTQKTVNENAEVLAAYNSAYDTWENRKNRNDRHEQARIQVIKKIRNDYEKIQNIKLDREQITKTFEEYKTLAINDEAAMKFLIKTFGKERITAIGMEIPEEEET